MDYIPKYFQSYELVPQATYRRLKDKPWIIWQLFDPRTLYVADLLRKRFGRMVCNTWYWGGKHHYRGWRPARCKEGATYSQHRFGRGLDLVPRETTAEAMRVVVKEGENFQYITCIEDLVWWFHFDVRNYKGLLIVTP